MILALQYPIFLAPITFVFDGCGSDLTLSFHPNNLGSINEFLIGVFFDGRRFPFFEVSIEVNVGDGFFIVEIK